MAATVFISNIGPGHDYSCAARWGALRHITQGNFPIFKTERLIEEIASVLVHSSPSDYLLLSGSSVIAGLCQSMWLSMHPICNTLLYDRTDGGNYVLRVIARSQLELTLERFKDAEEIRAREFRAKR